MKKHRALPYDPHQRFLMLRSAMVPVVLVCVALALMYPFATHGIMGGGDAKMYANTITDVLVQARAHHMPIWIGQSEHAMYGATFPPRFTPLLSCESVIIDLITGHRFPPFYVLNLTLMASLVGAVLSCYFCLRALISGRPIMMCFLSIIYAACPAILGLAYAEDMYLSFTTLPFIPIVFLGVVRLLERGGESPSRLLAVALAATWLGHPPIALWCGIVTAGAYLTAWFVYPAKKAIAMSAVFSLGLFGMLALYAFVAASSVAASWWMPTVTADGILFQIRNAFPGNLLPLPRAVALEVLQPGYSVLILIIATTIGVSWGRLKIARNFFAALICLLLVLVLPIPVLTSALWHLIPHQLLTVTNTWPMQRIGPLLACAGVFSAGLAIREPGLSSMKARWSVGIALAALVAWSLTQAAVLLRSASAQGPTIDRSEIMTRPENLVLSAVNYGLRSTPPRYLDVGVMVPSFELHLLDRKSLQISADNREFLCPGTGATFPKSSDPYPELLVGALNANPGILDLQPKFHIEPNHAYVLAFQFLHPGAAGILILRGREFYREYRLPISGESRSFGSGADCANAIPLATSAAEDIQIQFVPIGDKGTPLQYSRFARVALKEYRPEELPLRQISLFPYRARIRSATEAYLETQRLWIIGYVAQVDGKPTPVLPSPDGFVMIPVGTGNHEVTLAYRPPLFLRVSFLLTISAWMVVFAMLVGRISGSLTFARYRSTTSENH